MKRALKDMVKKAFPQYYQYRAFRMLVANRDSYLHQTGWLKSLEQKRPVDREGAEVPWMNYAVVEFLRGRLNRNHELFEFGSGCSTAFYSRLVKRVTSVESDEAWLETVRRNAPKNVEVLYKPDDVDGEYCRAVHVSGRKYDVVVVDGLDRVNCIRQGLEALSEGGVMVLDDSQRPIYAAGINHAQGAGFFTLSFEGLKPAGSGLERTTIFYRRNNCLGL
jgi:hypothetical protein